jgi:S-adenosylmethionine:tRNA ribosyltransferase-isomerase
MKRSDLIFDRPVGLAAVRPAEAEARPRDAGRLLVSDIAGHHHARFFDLPQFIQPGDLLVVNRSATQPASLPAVGPAGPFTLNLCTDYGGGLWLAEPRHSPAEPGPLEQARSGLTISAAGQDARLIAPYPGIPRLWFVQFSGDVQRLMARRGRPVRYGYLQGEYDLATYQTIFSAYPGSAEMPSAAYPFTRRVLDHLQRRGVRLASIVLHTGVSSLEVESEDLARHTLYPEPYWVPRAAATAVNDARLEGRRVIAVGTTVVRALESAWHHGRVRAASGFTRLYLHPERPPQVVSGLLTGLHDPVTSHLAMLYALAGPQRIREAYEVAVKEGYLWHEFGDSHLILNAEWGMKRFRIADL